MSWWYNLVAFLMSVCLYFLILRYILDRPRAGQVPVGVRTYLKAYLKRLAVLVPLCFPFNISGHTYTVMGNGFGEKGFYSLFSVFQKSYEGNAFALIGVPIYQEAANRAETLFGLSIHQKAGSLSLILAGLSLHQIADNGAVAGLALYQKSAKTYSLVAVVQDAGEDAGSVVSVYQRVGDEKRGYVERSFGVWRLSRDSG